MFNSIIHPFTLINPITRHIQNNPVTIKMLVAFTICYLFFWIARICVAKINYTQKIEYEDGGTREISYPIILNFQHFMEVLFDNPLFAIYCSVITIIWVLSLAFSLEFLIIAIEIATYYLVRDIMSLIQLTILG